MALGDNAKLHALFLPFFTPSHMIPLVNLARLFAAEGVKVTIITTKYNAALFQSSIDHATRLGHDISVHKLKFPSAELGLPEGIENFSAATTIEMLGKVYRAISQLQIAMEEFIEDLSPHCIISDMFYTWTVDLAEKMKIPRILFYPNNFVSHVVPHNLWEYEPHVSVKSDSESFLVPGLPDKIEMKSSQLEDHMKVETPFGEQLRSIRESAVRSFGLAFDAVYEFEPKYADYFGKVTRKKFWTIGPLFYFSNMGKTDNSADHGNDSCLNWLDTQGTNQVLYVSFGSIAKFSDAQLTEIASALEASNQPFIWVVRNKEKTPDDQQESWIPDGFEERISRGNRGLIIRGWAPQLKILNHPATGGFMTHCGWNSTMEAMTAGVPLITWPLFAEQFYNEKLLEVLKVGVSVGQDHFHASPVIEDHLVERKQIEEAINRLMRNSEQSQEIRDRAKEMATLAKRAVEEGGSSYQNLLDLIDALKSSAFGFNS